MNNYKHRQIKNIEVHNDIKRFIFILQNFEKEVEDFRAVMDQINHSGANLAQISPGEGGNTIREMMTRDRRRFEAVCNQIQKRSERLSLSRQRSMEVLGDIDEVMDWFKDTENVLMTAESISRDPEKLLHQMKHHKVLNDDVTNQKGKVRDVVSSAKKLMRESSSEDMIGIREKMDALRDTSTAVSKLSADRLSVLEQALPLAKHFEESHIDLLTWLDDVEGTVSQLDIPAVNPEQIKKQQDNSKVKVLNVLR